jgi:hypothetical protein
MQPPMGETRGIEAVNEVHEKINFDEQVAEALKEKRI